MSPSVIRCPSCGYVLKREDLKQDSCPYCRTAFVDASAASTDLHGLFPNDNGLSDLVRDAMSQADVLVDGTTSVTTTTTTKEGAVIRTVRRSSSVSTTKHIESVDDLPLAARQMLEKLERYTGPDAELFPKSDMRTGQRVFVAWSDGNRYPAQVRRVEGDKCEIRLSDGRTLWVDKKFLSPSK